MNKAWVSRVVPFAVYMSFIAIYSPLEMFLPDTFTSLYLTPVLYLLKIMTVGSLLIFFWKDYNEITFSSLSLKKLSFSFFVGVLVFILWINLDFSFATQGEVKEYNPSELSKTLKILFFAVRIFGASIVVPLFEEIFWRSFIIRYIVNPDFLKVKIGTFTVSSFVFSSVLFGLEHNLWLAGIIAGMLYNMLLYKEKNLIYCIFSHGVTNLILGIYVLVSGNWYFW